MVAETRKVWGREINILTPWRTLYNFFTSIKLALILIVFLTIGTVLGVTVLEEVFSSWWFLVMVATFFINTLFCTFRQISRTRREIYRAARGEWKPLPRCKEMFTVETADYQAVADRIAGLLRGCRYRVQERKLGKCIFLSGSKFKWGYWGIVIFHLGLLVIIVGGFLTFTTSFWGSFFVPEGMAFTDKHDNYVVVKQGSLYPKGHQNFKIRLDDVVLKYNKAGLLRDYTAKVTILEQAKEVKHGVVSGPTPLQYKGLILYKKLYGYAPGLTLTTPGGEKKQFRVVLDTSMHGEHIRHQGDFRLPGTVFDVSAAFFPDLAYAGRENPGLEAHRENDPGLLLTIKNDRETIYRGRLPLKSSIEFRDYSLSFDNYIKWYGFSVVKDRGITVVFTGFWITLLGTAIIYLLIPREMGVNLTKADGKILLTVLGRTNKYQHLFLEGEFAELLSGIKRELEQGVIGR